VEELEDAGFDPQVETVNSASTEEGRVIYSSPSAGTTALRGSTVALFVSTGPKLAKVPVLVGSQRRLAVQQIRGRGLTPSVSEEESSAPAGEVIGQSPSAGTEVELGSTVTIVVSSGEEQATVPNVIGKLRAAAVQAVRDAGLTPSVEEEETAVQGKVGRALDQFPPPGTELEPGDSVTIVVGIPAAAPSEGEEEGEVEP
jgi:eukaryotic-like serine/threonine-protein kinase